MKAYIFKTTPLPAPRLTQAVAKGWKGMINSRKKTIRAKGLRAQRYHNYKDAIRWEAKQLKFELPARIDLIQLHIPMFPSWSKKKKKALVSQPHQQKPDVDNYVKAILDALAPEDGYIWTIKVEKFWTTENNGRFCIYVMTEEERGTINKIISGFKIDKQYV